jgi:hypothetical protein
VVFIGTTFECGVGMCKIYSYVLLLQGGQSCKLRSIICSEASETILQQKSSLWILY